MYYSELYYVPIYPAYNFKSHFFPDFVCFMCLNEQNILLSLYYNIKTQRLMIIRNEFDESR